MKISEHADRSEKLTGLRAEDIHQWIDRFFDREHFDDFLKSGHLLDTLITTSRIFFSKIGQVITFGRLSQP